MLPTLRNGTLLTMATMACIAGLIDAAVGRAWDLVAVFALIILLQALAVVRLSAHRPPVPLRADLFRWLRGRAAATGASIESLADRAVSTYRSALEGDRS